MRGRCLLLSFLQVCGCSCDREGAGVPDAHPGDLDAAVDADPSTFALDEEFVGPFASWKNVHDYGAIGDGIADDTDAIQAALDELRDQPTVAHSVLWFPAGTYRITRTLVTVRMVHNDYLGCSIIGEDPATTILSWDGPSGGDMVHLDMWYGKVSRFTFDGRGVANVGLYRGEAFSTFCELSDLWFQDMSTGILLGRDTSAGQAEHAILRNKFIRCSDAGIITWNWNTLDIWVWYSLFEDCRYGLHNVAGNFHVYHSVFLRSTEADVASDNLLQFALVNNVSVGSKTFTNWESYHSWGADVLVQGNRIDDVSDAYAIVTGSAGPFLLVDNVIGNRDGYDGPAIRLTANDQILVGNTFVVPNAVEVATGSWRGDLRVRELDSRVVQRADLPPAEIEIPPAPPNRNRRIFEVPQGTGDDAQALQEQIDAAAAEPAGTRPVVHVAKGGYSLARTVVVPALRDLQIIGDGTENGSILNGTGIPAGPVLRFEGPSRALVREVEVVGAGASILVENADQSGGRVYAQQVSGSGRGAPPSASDKGIFVNGVEQADVTLVSCGFGNSEYGVVVAGGPARAAGDAASGQTSLLTGASSSAGHLYDVRDGGELLVEAVWYEGAWSTGTSIELTSSGKLTLALMQLAVTPLDASAPLFRIAGFRGDFSLFLSGMSGTGDTAPAHHIELAGDGASMRALVAGNAAWVSGTPPGGGYVDDAFFWRDTTSPAAQTALLQQTLYGSDPAFFASGQGFLDLPNVTDATVGVDVDDARLRKGLELLRGKRVEPPNARPAGVTDLQLFRVLTSVGQGGTAFEVRR